MQTVGNATLNGVTLNGNYLGDVGTNTFVSGTITQTGNLQLNAGNGNNTNLYIAGATTLTGGTVTMAYNGSGGGTVYIQQSGGNQTLTNAETIHGTGIIGNGGLTLVNAAGGKIDANVAGQTLALTPGNALDSQGAISNNGILSASAGTLAISPKVYGTGTIQTSGTGVVTLGGASSVGNLINNGSSANALTLGANNITVSSDYQNANFGVGNAFNKLADVSTTGGQILASGNVATAMTGTTVTNGTSPTATLTIGNVHVGDNGLELPGREHRHERPGDPRSGADFRQRRRDLRPEPVGDRAELRAHCYRLLERRHRRRLHCLDGGAPVDAHRHQHAAHCQQLPERRRAEPQHRGRLGRRGV